jgi:Tol biopolymer transport system component
MFAHPKKVVAMLLVMTVIVGCEKRESTEPNAETALPAATGTSVHPMETLVGEGTSAPTEGMIDSTAQTSKTLTPQVVQASEGLIVFYSERDGDAEIYIMNPDGSNQIPLTDNSADDFSPSWSPDGRLIAFESDRYDPHPRICFPNCDYNLYVMNSDGSDQRQLTALPGAEWNATWSPDGQSLLFNAGKFESEQIGIYRIGLEGGDPQPLLLDEFKNIGPDWSPNGEHIAFSSNRDGNLDIFVMEVDGSQPQKIVDTGIDDYFPDWSPDGSRITFFAADWPAVEQDIYIVDVDGSDLQNITNTPYVVDEDPRWSPDGSKIIFQSDRDGNFEIYIMNSDGSQPRNLSQHRGPDYWPDWIMPPGEQIAFVSDHGGRPQIYAMLGPFGQAQESVDVSELQPLTDSRYENYYPSWSPDGTEIVYYTHFSMQSWAIMIMNADGSNPRQLTMSEGETICSFGPVWSPEGQRIVFNIEPNSHPTCEMKATEIAVINIDGSGFTILTQNNANDLVGSWTPDGKQLIFTSDRDGDNQIYVMDADGGNPHRLTELGSRNSMPSLSPDGRLIAFVSNRNGNDEIYLMGADGSDPRRLTDNTASDWQPSWSPDGRQIVFVSGTMSNGFDIFVMNADGTGLYQLTDSLGWQYEPVWKPDPFLRGY